MVFESEKTQVNVDDASSKTLPHVPNRKGELSAEAKKLLAIYSQISGVIATGYSGETVAVSEVLSSVAFFYERVRNAVEYKGEHLLKRNAIERILKRKIWENPVPNPLELSKSLMRELIWARYIENASVPKKKEEEVSQIIARYLKILKEISRKETAGDKKSVNEIKEWFLGVASCEIEEALDPKVAYLDAATYPAYLWFKNRYIWLEEGLEEKEKDLQIFIAVHRSLTKSDEERVRHHLLQVFYPDWETADTEKIINGTRNLFEIREEIEKHMKSRYQPKIYRFVKRQSAAFQVLKEIVEEDIDSAQKVMELPQLLEEKIWEVCKARYNEIYKKVNRGIIRSIIYIFSTKVLFAFLVEIPYELVFIGSLNFLAITINTILPPSLMFFMGLTIRKPKDANTKRVIERVKSFVYQKDDGEKIKFTLTSPQKRSLTYRIFAGIYALLFILTFGGITYFLLGLGFNIASIGVFFVFLSLVLLFAYRVRFTASELNVTREKEGFLSHLFTNVSLPFLNLGVWLSETFSRFNFLTILMDFLFEVPFKKIISVFEDWTSFIRERKEEVVEVPS